MSEFKFKVSPDIEIYEKQGFGKSLEIIPPAGLLVVDFINGFADPEMFGGGNISSAIESTAKLLQLARNGQWPIAYCRTVFADDSADANVFTEKIPGNLALTENSSASQVVPSLQQIDGELVVRKQYPSAFFATPLAAWLTAKGVRTLVICGATTSGCVRASAVDAMCHGFRTIVVSNCVGDRSVQQHESNLFDMQMKCADVMSLDAVMRLSQLGTGT